MTGRTIRVTAQLTWLVLKSASCDLNIWSYFVLIPRYKRRCRTAWVASCHNTVTCFNPSAEQSFICCEKLESCFNPVSQILLLFLEWKKGKTLALWLLPLFLGTIYLCGVCFPSKTVSLLPFFFPGCVLNPHILQKAQNNAHCFYS